MEHYIKGVAAPLTSSMTLKKERGTWKIARVDFSQLWKKIKKWLKIKKEERRGSFTEDKGKIRFSCTKTRTDPWWSYNR